MTFSIRLASVLTGASQYQLRSWSKTDLLRPEVQEHPCYLYSFRDLVAIRTVAKLRAETSLQRIRRAFDQLREWELMGDHLAEVEIAVHGKDLLLRHNGEFIDLVDHPGQYEIHTMDSIFEPFQSLQGHTVVNFRHPRSNLNVDYDRLGGWPTISGTRVPYDVVAQAIDGDTITVDNVDYFYPGVSRDAARDAISFDDQVNDRCSVA